MSIREIDNRYPEFARPYEPVKGRKRYKKLKFPISTVFALLGSGLILAGAFGAPPKNPSIPAEPPAVSAPADPSATVPPTATVATPVTESPTPSISPSPVISPAPSISPPPTVSPPVTPYVAPIVYRPAEPQPPTSPGPDPSSVPGPSDPPVTPAPDPKPKEPTVSIKHVYFWDSLSHLEVEYEVTANEATDLRSSGEVRSSREPDMGVSLPETTEVGVIDVNVDTIEFLSYLSADAWETTITLEYKLDGESKSMTVSQVEPPALQGDLMMYPLGSKGVGALDSMNVTSNMQFRYPASDRHSYTLDFYMVQVGWKKEIKQADGITTFEDVGDTRTIWFFGDSNPFSGPVGPTADGSDMTLLYTYSDRIDVSPSSEVLDAGATHYFLIFSFGGVGTDTDGTEYSMQYPYEVASTPLPLDSAMRPPTIRISGVNYWGDLNVTQGLGHVEANYTIIPNDADENSITSDVKVSTLYEPYGMVSSSGVPGSGGHAVNMNGGGVMRRASEGNWKVEVTVHYQYQGEDAEVTNSWEGLANMMGSAWLTLDYQELGVANVKLNYQTGDRHSYSLTFESVSIEWFIEEDTGMRSLGDPDEFWHQGDDDIFSGPSAPTVNGEETCLSYELDYSDLELVAEGDATHYRLVVTASGTGTDSADGAVYTIYGGLRNWSEDYGTID